MITELRIQELGRAGHNRIPLLTEAFADLETPLSLYLKLAYADGGGKHSFLLESVVGGERGRYSFIGLPARTLVRATGRRAIEVVTDGVVVETHEATRWTSSPVPGRFKGGAAQGLPRFCGGLAGYFGYDTVRHIEPAWPRPGRTGGIGTPTSCCCSAKSWRSSTTWPTGSVPDRLRRPRSAGGSFRGRAVDRLGDKLRLNVPRRGPPVAPASIRGAAFRQGRLLKAVSEARSTSPRATDAGRRSASACKRFTESPLSLYRALRSLNPSPTCSSTTWATTRSWALSPEILVRHEHERRGREGHHPPIAGTRPRGATPEQDAANEELLADPKERAEHVMLIDLARNDIGRIAKTGSVKVTEAFGIERYSHVMHIVSNVEGC